MKTRYEILPRTIRITASIAAVVCTTAVMAGIAGLAEPGHEQVAQSKAVVVAQAGAGSVQIR